MWKPDGVVPEHRWRARIVWVGLLVSITGYTAWQIWNIFDGMANPSTSLVITNEVYELPFILVCFDDGEGCGFSDGSTDTCVENAKELSTVYDWNNDAHDDLVIDSTFASCVGFDLARLNLVDSIESGLTREDAWAAVKMEWLLTDTASTEINYIDSVKVYSSEVEPISRDLSYLGIPFTRFTPEDENLVVNAVQLTVGKTTKKALSGDVMTLFPPLTLSESRFTMENVSHPYQNSSSTGDYAYGYLYLMIKQGDFSRISITELSPMDVGTFLGNIGGFWELLILFWGLFFITTREEPEPKFKARNFVKTFQAGKRIVTRRRSLSMDSATSCPLEEQPAWEVTGRGRHATTSRSTAPRDGGKRSAMTFEVTGLGASHSTASDGHDDNRQKSVLPHGDESRSHSQRRPVALDMPKRVSWWSGDPPAGEGPSREDVSAC